MKMTNKILNGSLILLLVACASGPDEQKSASSNDGYSLGGTSESKASPEPKTSYHEEFERPIVATPASESQALADAIKGGNDEAVSRAAIAALSKNPNDTRALNAMGMYHYKKGHLKAAELFYGRALKANPQLAEVYNNLGLIHLAQDERSEAIKQFRKAIELNPNEANAASNLGSIYLNEKDYGKAAVAMEIAYRKNSSDVKILNNYGIALTAQKKFSEARDIYQKAYKLNQNDKDVLLNYSILLIEHMNKASDGLDLIEKLKFLGPSAEARNIINGLENKAKAG